MMHSVSVNHCPSQVVQPVNIICRDVRVCGCPAAPNTCMLFREQELSLQNVLSLDAGPSVWNSLSADL